MRKSDNIDTLQNNGTINLTDFATFGGSYVNDGIINVTTRRLRLRQPGTNNGTITVSEFGVLELFPNSSIMTNKNTIQINAGGSLRNDGTLDNQGTVTLACGGQLSGNPIQGNPVQIADRTPPTASPTQSPAANTAGWNNGDVTVSWNWSDAGGIDTANCTTSSTSSGEGTINLTATCRDQQATRAVLPTRSR